MSENIAQEIYKQYWLEQNFLIRTKAHVKIRYKTRYTKIEDQRKHNFYHFR